ncbi:hypothetical protein [Martelella alba]|uniref:Uncharacterized protein n=1 Tax=Martelella alba TaxID=2590451 RepID=A0ABY2SKB1_9HYPH|nr:hypothetical protein [Martelella alba]TKI05821.1 hypothetical protein FCN80_12870 [Martelella alba]
MLPAVTAGSASASVSPAVAPRQDVLSNLERHIRLETTPFSQSGAHYRRWGGLCWLENNWQSSLETRLRFIGELAEHLISMRLGHDKPITLISLGSGGMLFECYIHRFLSDLGFKNVRWRLIDLCYLNKSPNGMLEEFRLKAATENVQAFTSEQEYLRSLADGKALAYDDRQISATVVLCVNSPQDHAGDITSGALAGCRRFRATRVSSADLANSLFFMVSHRRYRFQLDAALTEASRPNRIVILDNALRCAMVPGNTLRLDNSPSVSGRLLNERMQVCLKDLFTERQKRQAKVTLADIDRLADNLADRLLQEHDLYVLRYFASDYDIGLENLRGFCADGSSTLLAKLDWNEITFV